MYKIAVMGRKESILGFKAVGIDTYAIKEKSDAAVTLDKLARNDYAVIFITEQVAKDLISDIEVYDEKQVPAIIPIPGNWGSLGIGMKNIKKCVERAVGADILFNAE
jgi:V/A-type H+/Na+-transporting ATPase subunit F